MKFLNTLIQDYLDGIKRKELEKWFDDLPCNSNTLSDPLPPYSYGRPSSIVRRFFYDLGHTSQDENLLKN